MKRGFPPQPTKMKILNGNLGRRPINTDEPKPKPAENLVSPAVLDEKAMKFWIRYAKPLADLGLLSEIDLDLLTIGAQWHSIHERALAKLTKSLTQKTNANGAIAKPEVAIAKQAFAIVKTVLSEFGAGPASRSRITGASQSKPVDPVEAFKRRKEAMKLIDGKKA